MVDDKSWPREHTFRQRAVVIGAPEVLQIGGGDELQAGRGDGGIAEDVEVLDGDVAADVQRVPGAAVDQRLLELMRQGNEPVRVEAIDALAGRAVTTSVALAL